MPIILSPAQPTIAVTTWYSKVVPDVPGCPLPMIERALSEAIKEFCMKTYYWQEDYSEDIVAGTPDYEITLADAALQIAEILWLDFTSTGGTPRPIEHKTPTQLRIISPTWASDTASEPSYYFNTDERTIRLWPSPTENVTAGLTGKLAVFPQYTTAYVHEGLYYTHDDDIASGAKARLMMIPKKPYSDPTMAVFHRKTFLRAIAETRAHVRQGLRQQANMRPALAGLGWP